MEVLALQPDSHRRRQLLQAGREWWKPQTVARLYDEVVRLVRVDLRQVERLARAAAWIAAQIDDEGSRATSHHLRLARLDTNMGNIRNR